MEHLNLIPIWWEFHSFGRSWWPCHQKLKEARHPLSCLLAQPTGCYIWQWWSWREWWCEDPGTLREHCSSGCGVDWPVAVAVSNVPVSHLQLGFLLTHLHWFLPVSWVQSPSLPTYSVIHQYPSCTHPLCLAKLQVVSDVCNQEPGMHNIIHTFGVI